ncbi:beta-1,3-galactosyl-O-glycosyl-glycoprotein beta-1,6-N-acetylglucosaminyltransferase 3-like [Chanos chanos]|uniref:Beta-1,3-galactosyl-O-glycosyl-glycoprotein beta-1,6-N-acetylglucosaminyltransferase 3 n=1 Tax=Chanos chanos TaxID=29144 RepID=A0A6J2WJE0_CHACN|nr:beta-1,3-galactosyl-O-glycosyl-glycoprotein beta-1,6-N-acetylglucosaminyltransferase 3-like [Chanos chanos]
MACVNTFSQRSSSKSISFILLITFLGILAWSLLRRHSENRQYLETVSLLLDDQEELQVCSAIIQGDVDGIKRKDFNKLLASKEKKILLSESFYLNATKDCDTYIRGRGFLTAPLSKEERDFPIAYSMVIHEKIEMFERLLRAIYTPQNVYCIHVDKKSSEAFMAAVRAIASCLPNVFVASKLESVVYASWSRVQADLNCMEDLIKSPVQWRYLLNTCGTDFPIKTNAEIVNSLKLLNGKNSLESDSIATYKNIRWQYHHNVKDTVIRTKIKKSPPPIRSPMFNGNAYFVVSRKFVEHLFTSPEAQAFIEWEKDTYSPDEHMWATLQRMPSVPGSNPFNQKFDTSDMMAIARLVKWSYSEGELKHGSPYPPCAGSYRRAVCVYGAGDLRWMLQQQHLFANKFDPEVDEVAIKCLEVFLRHKAIYGQNLL